MAEIPAWGKIAYNEWHSFNFIRELKDHIIFSIANQKKRRNKPKDKISTFRLHNSPTDDDDIFNFASLEYMFFLSRTLCHSFCSFLPYQLKSYDAFWIEFAISHEVLKQLKNIIMCLVVKSAIALPFLGPKSYFKS